MLGKFALEECYTIPEELERNSPAKFVPECTGDVLIDNLLDVHGQRL